MKTKESSFRLVNFSLASRQTNSPIKAANPYYANPFFRPKVVTNQPSNVNNSAPAITTTTTTAPIVTSTPSTAVAGSRGRPAPPPPPPSIKIQNPYLSTNGRTQEPDTTGNQTSTQDDNRRWAHNVASAPIARPTAVAFQSSETNVN